MGGLRKYMPITAGTFIIGWLAIAGIVPVRRLLVEGRDPRQGVVQPRLRAVGRRRRRRAAHRVLHDPPGVARLLRPRTLARRRRAARRERRRRTQAEHADDARRPHEPHESPWTMTCRCSCSRCSRSSAALIDLPFTNSRAQPARPLARAGVPRRARDRRRRRSARVRCSRRSRSSIAVVGIVVGIAVYRNGLDARRRRPDRRAARARSRRCFGNAYYFDVGIARFVSGPVTAFAALPQRRRRPRRASTARSTASAPVPRAAAAACARLQTGLVRNYALGIVLGAVLLLVYIVDAGDF